MNTMKPLSVDELDFVSPVELIIPVGMQPVDVVITAEQRERFFREMLLNANVKISTVDDVVNSLKGSNFFVGNKKLKLVESDIKSIGTFRILNESGIFLDVPNVTLRPEVAYALQQVATGKFFDDETLRSREFDDIKICGRVALERQSSQAAIERISILPKEEATRKRVIFAEKLNIFLKREGFFSKRRNFVENIDKLLKNVGYFSKNMSFSIEKRSDGSIILANSKNVFPMPTIDKRMARYLCELDVITASNLKNIYKVKAKPIVLPSEIHATSNSQVAPKKTSWFGRLFQGKNKTIETSEPSRQLTSSRTYVERYMQHRASSVSVVNERQH